MTNDCTHVFPRRPGSAALQAAAVIGIAAVALVVAACGGDGASSGTSGSSGSPSGIAYSACIRDHGVPNFPDPDSSGTLPKGNAQHFGVSASQYQVAQQACQHLLPTGGSVQQRDYQCMQNGDCPQALVQQMLTADRRLAQCMRSHGVPNFPDPTTDANGPIFNISAVGISDAASHSHRFEAKLTECARLVGDNAPESFE